MILMHPLTLTGMDVSDVLVLTALDQEVKALKCFHLLTLQNVGV